MTMKEINIDLLPGPTHHFGGLSFGNIASVESKATLSHPKKAALQSLEKMKLLADLGLVQLVLPPHVRPHIKALRKLGFTGKKHEIIKHAYKSAPHLLLMCSSSSAMWTANAATASPSCDTEDKKVHFTPTNLCQNFHRSLETHLTQKFLQEIFSDHNTFTHHTPLPSSYEFFDEGAANHIRFCPVTQNKGLHLFVFSRHGVQSEYAHFKYPRRHSFDAVDAIIRRHKLNPDHTVVAMQNQKAIDKGVFHNDVISTGFETLFLVHEDAFEEQQKTLDLLQKKAMEHLHVPLLIREIKKSELSLEDAVSSYFFNTQIVRGKNNTLTLIAPLECQTHAKARSCLESIKEIDDLLFLDLHESMKNGGGPACLRLRVQLTDLEISKISQQVVLDEKLYSALKESILTHYPDTFSFEDFLDPLFLERANSATYDIYLKLGMKHLFESEGD